MFAEERTLDAFAHTGYQNGFEGLPLLQRVTYPGTHGFPDATFDFILAKGLTGSRPTITATNTSDRSTDTVLIRLDQTRAVAKDRDTAGQGDTGGK
jgi:hypothetical protein